MGYIKCSVPNCNATILPLHRFPNPSNDLPRFKEWVDKIGNKDLLDMDPFDHFDFQFYSEGHSRLHKNAIPTLNVSGILPRVIAIDLKEQSGQSKSTFTEDHTLLQEPSTSASFMSSLQENELVTSVVTPRTPRDTLGRFKKNSRSKEAFRRRLFEGYRYSTKNDLEKNIPNLNSVAAQFLRCQLQEAGKSAKQRRFTKDDKILALALYNKGPKSYKFLSAIFALPSRATLRNFTSSITFHAGLNMKVFEALKVSTKNWDEQDKFISIIMDEMAIMPGLSFNEKDLCIHGCEDFGQGLRRKELADHALVVMIRGIKKKFKQPLLYCFTGRGGTKVWQLKRVVKQVVNLLLEIGLKPITIICDQATTNVATIKALIKDSNEELLRKGLGDRVSDYYFTLKNFDVYPIFDPPHLLKGIRNNFLTKDVEFIINGKLKTATWDHIKFIYEHDNAPNIIDGLLALPHLSDEHIYSHKMKKMKVKHAAQIFSWRLSATMNFASKIDTSGNLKSMEDTAVFLCFFDKLFDSVNGGKKYCDKGKMLRCGISDDSDHLRFWREEAIPLLNSIKFKKVGTKGFERPPNVTNWLFTIKNTINIWNILRTAGFEYLLGRNLNQDPIENFFGRIRSHGVRYCNPTPSAFTSAFKSVFINSTLEGYKSNFNCEDDDCQFLFTRIKDLIELQPRLEVVELSQDDPRPPERPLVSKEIYYNNLIASISKGSCNYVARFILKKIKRETSNCPQCREPLFLDKVTEDNLLIYCREYGGAWANRLCYPTLEFAQCFKSIHDIIKNTCKSEVESPNLIQIIKSRVLGEVDFSLFRCKQHNTTIINKILVLCIRTLVHSYCKTINNILVGKDSRQQDSKDVMKQCALEFYNKHKKFKK